jgi:hypothetical protein
VVDWSTVAAPACDFLKTPEIVGAATALCPSAFVVLVDNLGVIGSGSSTPADFGIDAASYRSGLDATTCVNDFPIDIESFIERYDAAGNLVASFTRDSSEPGQVCTASFCLASCSYPHNPIELLPTDYIESTVRGLRVAVNTTNLTSTPTYLALFSAGCNPL